MNSETVMVKVVIEVKIEVGTFEWALLVLKNDGVVRRKSWFDNEFISGHKSDNHIWRNRLNFDGEFDSDTYKPTLDDIFAKDWTNQHD